MEDVRSPLQSLSYGTLSQNMYKMQTVLPRLKQNLKHFYSGNISIDFMLNIFIFFSILKFTILHVYVTQARHFSYFPLFLIIM